MALVQLNCPHCRGLFQVDSSMAGTQVTCPHCRQVASLPPDLSPAGQSPSPAPSPSYSPTPAPSTPPGGMTQLNCPLCRGLFQVTAEMSGQQVTCPTCRGVVTIPNLARTSGTVAGGAPSSPAAGSWSPPGGSTPAPNPATTAPMPSPGNPPAFTPPSGPSADRYPPGFGPGGAASPGGPGRVPTSPATKPNAGEDRYPPGRVGGSTSSNQAPSTSGGPTGSTGAAYPPGFGASPISPQTTPWEQPQGTPGVFPAKPQAAVGGQGVSRSSNVDALLPPGAATPAVSSSGSARGGIGAAAGRPLPVGSGGGAMPQGPVVIPTEDGGFVSLRDPAKVASYGGEEVELRKLTPEQKARRRFVKNIIMAAIGILFLSAVALIILMLQ